MKASAVMATSLLLALAPPRAFADDEVPAEAEANGGEGYAPSAEAEHETLRFTGYLDVGFAKVFGNGSSHADGDSRVPADYGSDFFAPAINSRGEVASNWADNYFQNGFLPRSVGIDGRASFLLNTVSLDARYTPLQFPLMVFARVQLMPRFEAGTTTRIDLQQAFGRVAPIAGHEFFVFAGKFDSVFGIEYLENEANLRTGITPSLIARYTTGQSLGLKGLYRLQLPSVQSTLSLNAAVTTSGAWVEPLVNPNLSLTGVPVGTARLGYELQLRKVQFKLGASGEYGPRNDQHNPSQRVMAVGGDVRLTAFGFSLSAELLRLVEDNEKNDTAAGKYTGQGTFELASGFTVTGGYVTLAWTLPFEGEWVNHLTVYGRFDHRNGAFQGFTAVMTDRFTAGLRLDLMQHLALKVEGLINRELSGAPDVPNDVFTSSAVFSW